MPSDDDRPSPLPKTPQQHWYLQQKNTPPNKLKRLFRSGFKLKTPDTAQITVQPWSLRSLPAQRILPWEDEQPTRVTDYPGRNKPLPPIRTTLDSVDLDFFADSQSVGCSSQNWRPVYVDEVRKSAPVFLDAPFHEVDAADNDYEDGILAGKHQLSAVGARPSRRRGAVNTRRLSARTILPEDDSSIPRIDTGMLDLKSYHEYCLAMDTPKQNSETRRIAQPMGGLDLEGPWKQGVLENAPRDSAHSWLYPSRHSPASNRKVTVFDSDLDSPVLERLGKPRSHPSRLSRPFLPSLYASEHLKSEDAPATSGEATLHYHFDHRIDDRYPAEQLTSHTPTFALRTPQLSFPGDLFPPVRRRPPKNDDTPRPDRPKAVLPMDVEDDYRIEEVRVGKVFTKEEMRRVPVNVKMTEERKRERRALLHGKRMVQSQGFEGLGDVNMGSAEQEDMDDDAKGGAMQEDEYLDGNGHYDIDEERKVADWQAAGDAFENLRKKKGFGLILGI